MHFGPLRQRLRRGSVEPVIRNPRLRFWGMMGLVVAWVLLCLRGSEEFFGSQAVYDELILGAKLRSADVDFGFGGDYVGWGELAEEPYFPDFNFELLDAAWEAMTAWNESKFSSGNSTAASAGLPRSNPPEVGEEARHRFFWDRRGGGREGRRTRRHKPVMVDKQGSKGRRWGWLTRFFHRPGGAKNVDPPAQQHHEATEPCSPTRSDTEFRQSTLKALREELETVPGMSAKASSSGLPLTNENLARYLEMTDWHLHSGSASVADMVAHTVQWRLDHGVGTQPRPEFPSLAEGGVIYVNGHDREGRPVLIYTPTTDTGGPVQAGLDLLVYNLERAIAEAEAVGLLQYAFIVDLAKIGPVPPLKSVKAAFEIMGRHYPGRVSRIFLVHGGTAFYWLWKFLEPVIPQRTRARVSILAADDEEQVLTTFIPAAQLERRFKGGESDYVFDASTYFDLAALAEEVGARGDGAGPREDRGQEATAVAMDSGDRQKATKRGGRRRRSIEKTAVGDASPDDPPEWQHRQEDHAEGQGEEERCDGRQGGGCEDDSTNPSCSDEDRGRPQAPQGDGRADGGGNGGGGCCAMVLETEKQGAAEEDDEEEEEEEEEATGLQKRRTVTAEGAEEEDDGQQGIRD